MVRMCAPESLPPITVIRIAVSISVQRIAVAIGVAGHGVHQEGPTVVLEKQVVDDFPRIEQPRAFSERMAAM